MILDNVFSAAYTPKDHFNEIFFSNDWNDEKFSKFYLFMLECIVYYHQNGLVEYRDQDLKDSRLRGVLGDVLYDFIDVEIVGIFGDQWIEKKQAVEFYNDNAQLYISSNSLTRAIKKYCHNKRFEYKEKNSGGVFSFKIIRSEDKVQEKKVSNE